MGKQTKRKGVTTYMMLKHFVFNSDLSQAEKLLVASIIAYWSPSNMPFVSNRTLADNTGFSERYIRMLKRSLVDKGVFEVAHNKQGVSVYIFDEDEVKEGRNPSSGGEPEFQEGGTTVPEGGNPSSARGGTPVPTKKTIKNTIKNTTKTEAEVASEKKKKNKRIEFEPIFLEASDPSQGICFGIPGPELQNIEDKSYFTTVTLFLFERCKDVGDIESNAPICKQVLYALEYCTASAIYTKSNDVFTYLQYWKKYAEVYRARERSDMLDDLTEYIKSV